MKTSALPLIKEPTRLEYIRYAAKPQALLLPVVRRARETSGRGGGGGLNVAQLWLVARASTPGRRVEAVPRQARSPGFSPPTNPRSKMLTKLKRLWRRFRGKPTKPRVLRLDDLKLPVFVVFSGGKPLGSCNRLTCEQSVALFTTAKNAKAARDTISDAAAAEQLTTVNAVVALIQRAKGIGWTHAELNPTTESCDAIATIDDLLRLEA